MTFSVQETLFSLLRLNGISGHESSIANVMQHAFEQQAKDVWRDRLGNVVARYGSDKSDALRLMIFAHMGVSLEIGNFCTLNALFNQSWYVRDWFFVSYYRF